MDTSDVNIASMMEIFPDAIILIDEERNIISCNLVAEYLFGYDSGELLNKPLNILISHELHQVHDQHLKKFSKTKGKRLMDGRPVIFGLHKNGKEIPVSIAISSIENDHEKPFFMAVIRDALSVSNEIDKKTEHAERDSLTQLYNRDHLSNAFSSLNSEFNYALLFLDLNKFKPINDKYGHKVGDEVLRITSQRIRYTVRECDICVRYGGDEFVIILMGISSPVTLEFIAHKINASINKVIHVNGINCHVGASIGGLMGTYPGDDLDSMIKKADMAMYQAKCDGIPFHAHEDCNKRILNSLTVH